MLAGAQNLAVPVLIILSGEDFTANEFEDLVVGNQAWTAATERDGWNWVRVEGANHTFASRVWKQQVSDMVSEWLESL